MNARVSRYDIPTDELTAVGRELRAAVRAKRGGYDTRLLAAFLGVDRESGRSVAITVASDEEALRRSPAEPDGFEPTAVARYDVGEAYLAEPERFDATVNPRLYIVRGERWREPDELVDAAFGLGSATESPLVVAFAEWPEWGQRVGAAEVYDLEYFMVRHGAPAAG
jgi:hypothetical protein